MAAAQMPKFHALSVIQDQLRGNGMNLIPLCVIVCVRVRVHHSRDEDPAVRHSRSIL